MRAQVQLAFSPVIAGLLGLEVQAFALPLAEGRPSSLRDIVERLEKSAPGSLLEPVTRQLHRHIHVRVNRRPVSRLEHPLEAGDRVRFDMRMIEGG